MGKELPYRMVMPVCSGGMHPALVEPLVKIAGHNVQVQAGGGVAGHPEGVRGGAKAMAQAVMQHSQVFHCRNMLRNIANSAKR